MLCVTLGCIKYSRNLSIYVHIFGITMVSLQWHMWLYLCRFCHSTSASTTVITALSPYFLPLSLPFSSFPLCSIVYLSLLVTVPVSTSATSFAINDNISNRLVRRDVSRRRHQTPFSSIPHEDINIIPDPFKSRPIPLESKELPNRVRDLGSKGVDF